MHQCNANPQSFELNVSWLAILHLTCYVELDGEKMINQILSSSPVVYWKARATTEGDVSISVH